MFSRKCPKCKSKITYNSQLTYLRAVNKNTQCGGCAKYNKNPFPFTKKEFCELYYNQNKTMEYILNLYNYNTKSYFPGQQSRILKRFNLPQRKEVIKLRKKRFVSKYYNTCPITAETSDYLIGNDYNNAYRNLVDRFENGYFMRHGSSVKANTPNLSIQQLRLRFLLEKHTDKTICCQCVEIKNKNEMAIKNGRPRTCLECILPKEREKAKEYAKKKREELGKEEYNKLQREYRKNMSPEKKYEQYQKVLKWKSNQPNWGNKPMTSEEIICRRLLHLVIRMLGTDKECSTYDELGYGPNEFYNEFGLRPDGCDLDHKIPISWFKSGTPFSIVNSFENLQWIDSNYNRAKQNFWFDNITFDFYINVLPHIKENRLSRFIIDDDIVCDNSYGEYKPEYIIE